MKRMVTPIAFVRKGGINAPFVRTATRAVYIRNEKTKNGFDNRARGF